MSCTVYLATEAATPLNGPVVGDRPWLGGPTVMVLSAVDGPLWTKCGSHAWSGGSSMAAALDPGGPIVE